jgi:hypothetical protein
LQKKPANLKCLDCGYSQLTCMEARQSFARMASRGIPPDEAKRLSPRCSRCATKVLPPPQPRASYNATRLWQGRRSGQYSQ